MPISTIDANTALLVIDLQHGLAETSTVHPVREVASRAGELADTFRQQDLPVVLVNAVGVAPGRTDHSAEPVRPNFTEGFADLLPELGQTDSDHTVSKARWGAFHGTGLYDHLTALGVTQVVIAGVATSMGVESTARAAYDHGFHVTIATDAVTDIDPTAHHNSLTHTFPHLGETGTIPEIITALTR